MLIKYIKSVLWRVAKRLSYIEEARCLKVNVRLILHIYYHSLCYALELFVADSAYIPLNDDSY